MSSPYDIQVIQAEEDPTFRPDLVMGGATFASIDDAVAGVAEGFMKKPSLAWYAMFGLAISILGMLGAVVAYLLFTGVGIWGN